MSVSLFELLWGMHCEARSFGSDEQDTNYIWRIDVIYVSASYCYTTLRRGAVDDCLLNSELHLYGCADYAKHYRLWCGFAISPPVVVLLAAILL